jgi:hypothetical protein
MSGTHKHFAIQILVLSAWAMLLTSTQKTAAVEPFTCPTELKFLAPPPLKSWPWNSSVVVRIDSSFSPTDWLAIKNGVIKWNNAPNCSLVSFSDFEPQTFTSEEYSSPAPDGKIYWQRVDINSPFSGGAVSEFDNFLRVKSAKIIVKPSVTNTVSGTYFTYLGTHETGHTLDLQDCLCQPYNCNCEGGWVTIMQGHSNDDPSRNTAGPYECDNNAVDQVYCPQIAMPETEEECELAGFFWNFASGGCFEVPQIEADCQNYGWYWNFTNGNCQGIPWCTQDFQVCEPPSYWSNWACSCIINSSPIVIDVLGNGISLTNHREGVPFDLNSDGSRELIAWTSVYSDDAWLTLDRNGNGTIDNGGEMFGNFTPQPIPPSGAEKNGFLALAEYDKGANGGDGDGEISKSDSIFESLRLWRDSNHNGVSEPGELSSLPSAGLKAIELDFKESKKTDQYGNKFKYRAKVRDTNDAQLGRWAWDVYLLNPDNR